MASKTRRDKLAARRRAAVAIDMQRVGELRQKGACCGSCRAFSKAPASLGEGHVCDRHSDRDGYLITSADGLCSDWVSRPTPIRTGYPACGSFVA